MEQEEDNLNQNVQPKQKQNSSDYHVQTLTQDDEESKSVCISHMVVDQQVITKSLPTEEFNKLQISAAENFQVAKQYEATLLLEVLKNDSDHFFLTKQNLEKEVYKILSAVMQQRLGDAFNPQMVKGTVKMLEVDKATYPYVATFKVTIQQNFAPNDAASTKIPFFDLYFEDRNIFRRFPAEISQRKDAKIVYKFFLHLHPMEEINKQKSYYIISEIGAGQFGAVFLVKNTNANKIYALKKIPLGNRISQGTEKDEQCYKTQLERIQGFLKSKDINKLDDSNTSGDPNNPMREIKTLKMTENSDTPSHFIKLHKVDLKQEVNQQGQQRYYLYLVIDFFGGVEFKKSSVYEYFLNQKDFTDIGCEDATVSRITSKIFLDLLRLTDDMHKLKLGIRDLHDDNVLILRKPDNKFAIRLCDFGLVGHLEQGSESLSFFSQNQFRNPKLTGINYKHQEFQAAHDFYGLGQFLKRLVAFYSNGFGDHTRQYFFSKQDQDLIQLLMQEDITKPGYPKSIQELKKHPVFVSWLKVHGQF